MKCVRYFYFVLLFGLAFYARPDAAQKATKPDGLNSASQQQSAFTYDVATIKPNISGGGKWDIWISDNTWRAANVSTRSLLSAAFGIDENLIFGLPAWTDAARYDISAKISDASPDEIMKLSAEDRSQMLQALLAERFEMRTHIEQREVSCFELTLRQPARAAPGLRQATEKSLAGLESARAQQRPGTHLMAHRQVEISALIEDLSTYLHWPVVDATGLKGEWDIDLSWLRDNAPPSAAADIPTDIFTAVREQLGLDLHKTRTKAPVLVVDRWSQPTPN